MPHPRPRVLFTDLDGTLVHYASHTLPGTPPYESSDLLTLPPSTTGLAGTISAATLSGLARLRSLPGMHVVIVSGARSSTLDRRLPYLPACDAVAAEGGGRLHWCGRRAAAGTPVLADLTEDVAWRGVHAETAGPPTQGEGVPPAQRVGVLWDFFRALTADGWTPDAAAYTTAFRLPLPADGSKTAADLDAALKQLPQGLQATSNLGCADVLASSGKAGVGAWVMAALGADPADCAFLCDDANDVGLAKIVGRVFVVRATDPAIAAAAEAEPAKFWVAEGLDGNAAADAAVGAALAWAMGVAEDGAAAADGEVSAAGGRELAPA
jgi:hydroxymethylpyrimidine pyrophosphatase-like HAD family hydrolase